VFHLRSPLSDCLVQVSKGPNGSLYVQAFASLSISIVWLASPITFFALQGTLETSPLFLATLSNSPVYTLCASTNTRSGYRILGELRLGPFGLVHRLSNLGGILSYVRVGEGAITGLVDRVLLFLALAFQPSIV